VAYNEIDSFDTFKQFTVTPPPVIGDCLGSEEFSRLIDGRISVAKGIPRRQNITTQIKEQLNYICSAAEDK
jgi:hypothetical protein